MSKKTLKANLSVSSIRNMQTELKKYRDGLEYKARQLAENLAKRGVKVAERKIEDSPLGKYVALKTEITEEQAGCKAILIATGKNIESEGYAPFNTLLAIEFGAGIHYNPLPNPNADEFGLGVGTFPSQIHAFEDYWFYWNEEKQKWLPTHGVEATMPMYYAGAEIQRNIVKEAKKIFKN